MTARLPGGHRLEVFSPPKSSRLYLFVPGFDAVDAVRGTQLVTYNAHTRGVVRVRYATPNLRDNYLDVTYGYSLAQLASKVASGRTATTPRFVASALRVGTHPLELTDRSIFGTVAALSRFLGRPVPTLGSTVLGLPSVSAQTIGDHSAGAGMTDGAVVLYSRNRRDPARAAFFITESIYDSNSAAARGDLARHHIPVFRSLRVQAFTSQRDRSEIVATIGTNVVVISASRNLTRVEARRVAEQLRLEADG